VTSVARFKAYFQAALCLLLLLTPPALAADSRCPSRKCRNVVQSSWRFCKYCGTALKKQVKAPPAATGGITLSGLQAVDASYEVMVEQQSYGHSTRINGLKPGSHIIRVSAPGFKPLVVRVVVVAGKSTDVSDNLVRETGSIFVKSTSQDDQIYLDGKAVGRSPQRIDHVPVGPHGIRIEAKGFKTETREVVVTADQRADVEVQLVQITGSILVEATGQADRVLIDNQPSGPSGKEIPNVLPGPHTVTVTAEGFLPATKVITVEPDKTSRVELMLQPAPGTLTIAGTGQQARVYVDGKLKGSTNPADQLVLSLDPGRYTVRVEADGFEPVQRDVSITAGKDSRVSPVLRRADPVAAAIVLILDAGKGGSFEPIRGDSFLGKVGAADAWKSKIQIPGWESCIVLTINGAASSVMSYAASPQRQQAIERMESTVRALMDTAPGWKAETLPTGDGYSIHDPQGAHRMMIVVTPGPLGHQTGLWVFPSMTR
jgi:hypothetical protein